MNYGKIPNELSSEILELQKKSDLDREGSHAVNTLEWVLKIKPEASLSLQIAALAHDIERAVPPRYRDTDFDNHEDYKFAHSQRGAQILEEILRRHKLDEKLIQETTDLVRRHEVGGNEDADVLMDADSISFFDNNLEFYIGYKGWEGAVKQVQYKYGRCSDRARRFIDEIEEYKKFKSKLK